MKSSTMRSLVLAVSFLVALGACQGREKAASDESTATIAPATPQPEATGTDAMTQTVELGDGRPVSEGAAASEEGTDTAAAPMTENPTTTTASTTTR